MRRFTHSVALWLVVVLTAVGAVAAPTPSAQAAPVRGRHTSLAVGDGFACTLTPAGTVRCAGANAEGQLGVGSTTATERDVTVAGLSGVVSIDAGVAFTCALRANGSVVCWGANADGQLGIGTTIPTAVPTPVPGITTAVSIAAGDTHACAALADGTVACWGANVAGAVTTDPVGNVTAPQTVAGVSDAVEVSAGSAESCALRSDGTIVCWGGNFGLDAPSAPGGGPNQAPFVLAYSDAVHVAAGGWTVCAIDSTGTARCSGIMTALGGGVPAVPALSDVVDISVSQSHICLVRQTGEANCAGQAPGLDLGDGLNVSSSDVWRIVRQRPGVSARAVDIGPTGSRCLQMSDGQPDCWGALRTDTDASVPLPVRGVGGVATSLSSGHYGVCARLADGRQSCWGLASPAPTTSFYWGPGAADVPTLLDLGALTGIEFHSWIYCGSDGTTPKCGGEGGSPQPLADVATATDVAVGLNFQCFVTGGTVRCGGWETSGELGDGPAASNNSWAIDGTVATSITDAVQIAAGHSHACAVRTGGTVSCWGQLGSSSARRSVESPEPVAGLTGISQLVAETNQTCALGTDHSVRCWGEGPVADSDTPVTVTGLGDAVELSLGDELCGRDAAGTVRCTESHPDFTGATDLTATGSSTCAVVAGTVYCWSTDATNLFSTGRSYRVPGALFASPPPAPVVTPPGPATPDRSAQPLATPGRLLDTRTGGTTIDGAYQGTGRLAAGGVLRLPVGGRAGVSSPATAAVLNVTVVDPADAGYITVFPCPSHPATAADVPTASSGNFAAGDVNPASVYAGLAADGTVCIYSTAATDLLVDTNAFFAGAQGLAVLAAPARLLETRPGAAPTLDGQSSNTGRVAAGSTTKVHVADRLGVAADATLVALNVTAVAPASDGYVTVYPCTAGRPDASNVNYHRGQVVPNTVLARVDEHGDVCLYTDQEVDLLVDATGAFRDTQLVTPLTAPARFLDTRTHANPTFDGVGYGAGTVAAYSVTRLGVAGRGGIPTNARAAVLNVTAVDPGGAGYISVYPCGQQPPNVSSLNIRPFDAAVAASGTVANHVTVGIGTAGEVCLMSTAATDLLVDVSGWLPAVVVG